MIINHNIASMQVYNELNRNTKKLSKSIEKLSSGLRINSAADDAAGLAISEKMRSQIHGLDQAKRNVHDAISLIQTAEGALGQIQDSNLQRMRELAVQAANDTLTQVDRQAIQKEFQQGLDEINKIAGDTEFNTKKLLDGSLSIIPAKPPIPPSSSIDVTSGGMGKTILDGNIPIGTNGAVVRLNSGEQIMSDEPYQLYIQWDNGKATGLNILKSPSGLVVAPNYSSPIYSVNGLTFDVSGALLPGANGNQYQGTVVFHAGNNSTIPGTSEIDNTLKFQIGANSNQNISLSIDDFHTANLNLGDVSLLSSENAEDAISTIDIAIEKVSSARSNLGAVQNRLEHSINNLGTSSENLSNAESRIRDVDMAKEMMNQSKASVLSQAAQAMLAQANQQPQQVLQLLRG